MDTEEFVKALKEAQEATMKSLYERSIRIQKILDEAEDEEKNK